MSKSPKSNSSVRPIEDQPPNTPRWVKVSGITAIVIILLVVIMMFINGGKHGPKNHGSRGEVTKQIKQEKSSGGVHYVTSSP